MPAQAQMDDGELPSIDFSVNLMQSAQYISLSEVGNADLDPVLGFHRARAGLNANVQFAEGVSGLVMIEQEPNDFGGGFGSGPAIDFMVMNIQATPNLTIQAGTPVTGLMNFRGFSDGPVVQSNPLIGNSPADMITAGEGVKLIGSYDTFGFDVTAARTFGEDLTNPGGGDTGLQLIGNVRYTGSDLVKVGAGIATATGTETLDFATGDRENYNLDQGQNNGGNADSAKDTHAAIPGGGFIGQLDAKITPGNGLSADLWAGYASDSEPASEPAAAFGGVGAKFDINESFYVAGRFTIVSDQSDLEDADALTRIQGGVGYFIADNALLKVEGVTQSYGDGSAGPAASPGVSADGFSGVLTELSFNF
jgi:hypothetical protein